MLQHILANALGHKQVQTFLMRFWPCIVVNMWK